jgi:hypothetical protein
MLRLLRLSPNAAVPTTGTGGARPYSRIPAGSSSDAGSLKRVLDRLLRVRFRLQARWKFTVAGALHRCADPRTSTGPIRAGAGSRPLRVPGVDHALRAAEGWGRHTSTALLGGTTRNASRRPLPVR